MYVSLSKADDVPPPQSGEAREEEGRFNCGVVAVGVGQRSELLDREVHAHSLLVFYKRDSDVGILVDKAIFVGPAQAGAKLLLK